VPEEIAGDPPSFQRAPATPGSDVGTTNTLSVAVAERVPVAVTVVAVTAPVTSPVTSPTKPLAEFTGPENEVVPIGISCRGKCQPHNAAVRDVPTLQEMASKEKGLNILEPPTLIRPTAQRLA